MIVSLTKSTIPEGSGMSGSVYEGWSGQGRPTLTVGNPILGVGVLGWLQRVKSSTSLGCSLLPKCGFRVAICLASLPPWFPCRGTLCALALCSKRNPSFPKMLWSGLLSQQGEESWIGIAWVLRICHRMMGSPTLGISIKTTRKSSTGDSYPWASSNATWTLCD